MLPPSASQRFPFHQGNGRGRGQNLVCPPHPHLRDRATTAVGQQTVLAPAPRTQFLIVKYEVRSRQSLVYSSSAITLWPQVHPLLNSRPVNIKLMGTNSSKIPTFNHERDHHGWTTVHVHIHECKSQISYFANNITCISYWRRLTCLPSRPSPVRQEAESCREGIQGDGEGWLISRSAIGLWVMPLHMVNKSGNYGDFRTLILKRH